MTIEELIKQQEKSPKEIANEMVKMFIPFTRSWNMATGWVDSIDDAKECALIAIEFKLKSWFSFIEMQHENDSDSLEFWEKVKTEIENL